MMVLDTDPEAEPGDMVCNGTFTLPPGYSSREIDLAVINLYSVDWDERDTLHTLRTCIAATQEWRGACVWWGHRFKSDPRPFSSTPKPRRVKA